VAVPVTMGVAYSIPSNRPTRSGIIRQLINGWAEKTGFEGSKISDNEIRKRDHGASATR